jgi:hypothetical protein
MDGFARMGSSNAPDRTHGTPDERVAAARAGFEVGFGQRGSLQEGVRASLEYVGYRG